MTQTPADTPSPPTSRTARCPICGRPARPEARPFCSPRCRDVDLARWLGGAYSIPGEPLGEIARVDATDPDELGDGVPVPDPANER